MEPARPLAVTLVSWYAVASGAVLAFVAFAFAASTAAFMGGASGVLIAVPGLVAGALAIVGGHASLQGKPWARAVLLAGLACGALVGGMLFFLGPVMVVGALHVVAMVALFQPDAKAWYAASARERPS